MFYLRNKSRSEKIGNGLYWTKDEAIYVNKNTNVFCIKQYPILCPTDFKLYIAETIDEIMEVKEYIFNKYGRDFDVYDKKEK